MATGKNLARAAALGLIVSLSIAAVGLAVSAAWRLRVDCAGLQAGECGFEQDTARELARLQSFAALGCALVAGGLFVALRRRSS